MANGKSNDELARAVVNTRPAKLGCVELTLECGHVQRRRLAFCAPARVICPLCAQGAAA